MMQPPVGSAVAAFRGVAIATKLGRVVQGRGVMGVEVWGLMQCLVG